MDSNEWWKGWLDGLGVVDNGMGVSSWGCDGCARGHLWNLKYEKIVTSSSKLSSSTWIIKSLCENTLGWVQEFGWIELLKFFSKYYL